MTLSPFHRRDGHPRRPGSLVQVAAIAAWLMACNPGDGSRQNPYRGDASFGEPAQPLQEAGLAADGGSGGLDAGYGEGATVRLRVFSGAVNLGRSYLCHDPSFRVDDPATSADETSPVLLASELPMLDGGAAELGAASAYAELSPLLTGALTIHRAPDLPDGGLDDGGVADAALHDAEVEGGEDADAGTPRCGLDSLEALLPLPASPVWINPQRPVADAGATDAGADGGSLQQRGFVAMAAGGDTLTLYGSGLALDRAELMRREQVQRDAVLAQTGDEAEAAAAARRQRQLLEATYGLRFLPSRAGLPEPGRVALAFSHLIPDVPSVPVGRPAPDTGSGALHLCITVGGLETDDALTGPQGFEFRNFTALSAALDPNVAYRFRLFVQADFPSGPTACTTTSLKPVAELTLEPGSLLPDRSYTLVAWGALASDAICAGATPLVRAGCPKPADQLGPRLMVLEN